MYVENAQLRDTVYWSTVSVFSLMFHLQLASYTYSSDMVKGTAFFKKVLDLASRRVKELETANSGPL